MIRPFTPEPERHAPRTKPAAANAFTGSPSLRLTGAPRQKRPTDAQRQPPSTIRDHHDPRWVLAVRTAEQLEGTLLRPERRERLLRTGKLFGLSAFDCNLVIAIVQDQARRGHKPEYCPTAGAAQLSLIPLPRHATLLTHLRTKRALWIATLMLALLALEALLLWLVF